MESVTFMCRGNRFTMQIEPEKPGIHPDSSGMIKPIPANVIRFEGGKYLTDDPKVIGLIKATPAFKRHEVFTLTEEKAAEEKAKPPAKKTVRGSIDSKSLEKEAGVQDSPEMQAALKEKGVTHCDFPKCKAVFENDFTGKRLRMHKLSHRRKKK